MKKYLYSLLAISAICSSFPLEAKKNRSKTFYEDVSETILWTDFLAPETMKPFLEGEILDVVVECREGDWLPIKFLGNYGLISAKYEPDLAFKIEKTVYLRFMRKNALSNFKTFASFDLKKWEKGSSFLEDQLKGRSCLTEARLSDDKTHILVESQLIQKD